jgi:hypothetical protein
MNRDDIIRMAREAGKVRPGVEYMPLEVFERFAHLVAAAEREKVAEWMMARAYATGHGETTEELLEELGWQIEEKIAREREACAKVCEEIASSGENNDRWTITRDIAFNNCAFAIRKRGAP